MVAATDDRRLHGPTYAQLTRGKSRAAAAGQGEGGRTEGNEAETSEVT
jgi:hypothetical protein